MKKVSLCVIIGVMIFFSLGCFARGWSKKLLREYFDNEKVIELTYAAIKDDVKTIDKLIKEGVDVNYRGKEGYTPLYCSITIPKGYWVYTPKKRNLVLNFEAKNIKAFERLLTYGANPNIKTEDNVSAMQMIVSLNNPDFLRLALKYGGDPNITFYNNPSLKIKYGTDGTTLLMDAIGFEENVLEKVKLLVEAGAKIDAQNKEGSTALMKCVMLGLYDIAFYLLEQGADYKIRDKDGDTFVWGIENKFIVMPLSDNNYVKEQIKWRRKVIEFLKEKGIEVHLKYDDEWHFKKYGIKPF